MRESERQRISSKIIERRCRRAMCLLDVEVKENEHAASLFRLGIMDVPAVKQSSSKRCIAFVSLQVLLCFFFS